METKAICAALAKAQAKMGRALKDSTNPAFKSKYADLASVMDACLPALNEAGIAVIQPFHHDEFGRYVKTILAHESGETLECAIPLIVGKNDMQGLGSAITYARRYGLMSMAGIAPDDDDGNAAAASVRNVQREALAQTREDAVLDSLPEDATPRQKAEAYADAICTGFKGKGLKALDGEWARWKRVIDRLSEQFSDLHDRVVDAYEMRKNEIIDAERVAAE